MVTQVENVMCENFCICDTMFHTNNFVFSNANIFHKTVKTAKYLFKVFMYTVYPELNCFAIMYISYVLENYH